MRLLLVILLCPFWVNAQSGPFDGQPFKPAAPVVWAFTNRLPESLPVYRVATVKTPASVISNAMQIGDFKAINLAKTKDADTIEFRVGPDESEVSRFIQISAKQGSIKFYDRLASAPSAKGVPSLEEAQKLALQYFVKLGGNTNEAPKQPWPHNESTITSFDKPGGTETAKRVSSRSILVSRSIKGVAIPGNDFMVKFGSEGKPITIELNWPPVETAEQQKIAGNEQILQWLKAGRAFLQALPPLEEDVTQAKSYRVKNVLLLYRQDHDQIAPYGSLLIEANMGERTVDFVANLTMKP